MQSLSIKRSMLSILYISLSVFIIQFPTSCKKKAIETIEDPTEAVVEKPAAEKGPSGEDLDENIITVGSSDGRTLTIDGKKLRIGAGTVINIKAGTYQTIIIKDITGVKDNPAIIRNSGVVTITERMTTDNIRHVTISGDGEPTAEYGFRFRDIAYRALVMSGVMDFVTLKQLDFKNVVDYCISSNNSNNSLKYTGTSDSRTTGFKILNCRFDNTGSVVFGGNLNKSEDSGLFKDVEIAHNLLQNSNAGSLFQFSNVEDFDVHHNIVNNVNTKNNNHNGIFHMQGNGNFHHNKLTNYQGNAIRLWPYSRGNTPKTVEIHHNICYNTRKYGAFEIQAFERNMVQGKTTFVNAKVYHNTVGKMNTSKDWDGQVLDLYNMQGGSLEYYNNLGFELYSGKEITNMIHMGGPKITKNSDNIYKTNWSDAVSNTVDFVSKIPGVRAK